MDRVVLPGKSSPTQYSKIGLISRLKGKTPADRFKPSAEIAAPIAVIER